MDQGAGHGVAPLIAPVTGSEVDRTAPLPTASDPHPLTEREVLILQLFADGLTTDGIADLLQVSRRTIHAHRRNIHLKLGVATTLRAVVLAMREGLIR